MRAGAANTRHHQGDEVDQHSEIVIYAVLLIVFLSGMLWLAVYELITAYLSALP